MLFFNVGVEAGQLLFGAAVFALTGPVRRAQIAMPGWAGLVPPYAIGSVAMLCHRVDRGLLMIATKLVA